MGRGSRPEVTERIRIYGPAAIVLGTFAALSLITWRRSGLFLIDFGRELYIPWQISQGAVLYRDIDSLMGPAAAYLNAAIFSMAGPSVTALLAANLVVILLTVGAIAYYFKAIAGRWTLALALLAFLVFSMLSQLSTHGIFSFVTPYSHDATHGLLYAMVALIGIVRVTSSGKLRDCLLAGGALGATFLTKPEVFVATASGFALAAILAALPDARRPRRGRVQCYAVVAASALAIPVLAFSLFRRIGTASTAISSVMGAWQHVANVAIRGSPFYLRVSGLDAPSSNLLIMIATSASILIGVGAGCFVTRRWGRLIRRRAALRLVVVFGCTVVAIVGFALSSSWLLLPRALPLLTLVGAVYVGFTVVRERNEQRFVREGLPLIVWAAFSLALMAKSLLAVRLHEFGFYLGVPAVVFLMILGIDWLPNRLEERYGGSALAVRSWVVMLVAALAIYQGAISVSVISKRAYAVGEGADMIRHVDPEISGFGIAQDSLLQAAEQLMAPSATLAVLPEGAGMNYLLRRPNPTPHISILPPEQAAFGAAEILADLRHEQPSYLITWPRSLRHYGFGRFGVDQDFAGDILAWIDSVYTPILSVPIEGVSDALADGEGFVLYELDRSKARSAQPGPRSSR